MIAQACKDVEQSEHFSVSGRSEDILTHFRSQTTDTVDPQGMSLPRTLRLGEGKDCGPDAS